MMHSPLKKKVGSLINLVQWCVVLEETLAVSKQLRKID